ncbi:MAG: hypothetical protein ACE5EC_10065 [Phycisphaerae bacterium]
MTNDTLAAMKPLPFPCYSWPLPDEAFTPLIIVDWARVTHSVSLRGETCTEDQVRLSADACGRINRFHPNIPATIAINWSPYQQATYGPTETGRAWVTDIIEFYGKLRDIERWSGDTAIGAVLLDHEKWKVAEVATGTAALDARYDAFYSIVKHVFPQAMVYLYMRGESGQHLTGNELGDGTSTRLYWPTDRLKQARLIDGRRNNPAHGTPLSWWIALGWSRDHFEGGTIQPVEYPTESDWFFGGKIAEKAPDEPVILYPSPFDGRLTDPWDHFAAFVEGATRWMDIKSTNN